MSKNPNFGFRFQGDDESGMPLGFHRHYRYRLIRENSGQLYEVWDTQELPFEAPNFPRGMSMFEAIASDKDSLLRQVAEAIDQGIINRDDPQAEILEAPADIRRCRLYCIPLTPPDPVLGQFNYIEVWDTLAEPCEYRHDLPVGELLVNESDFSWRTVRKTINGHMRRLGIVLTGPWKVKFLGI